MGRRWLQTHLLGHPHVFTLLPPTAALRCCRGKEGSACTFENTVCGPYITDEETKAQTGPHSQERGLRSQGD